jgi:DNA modification methylase
MTGAVKNWELREKYREVIPSTSYLTHGIHSYTAKLIPHIPRYFIENYTCEGDTILDPFCGSGTALLEARLLHRNAIGIDINPLAALISEVKTQPLDINELSLAIRLVKKEVKNGNGKITVQFPNIDYWFCKDAQDELSRIKFSVENLNDKFNESIYKFLLVCLSSIIRKSSYADPRMAKTYKSKRVIEKVKNGWGPKPTQYFEDALDKNFERIKSLSERPSPCNSYMKVFQGDVRETSALLKQNGIKKVNFIITSPPYINAQDYFRSYKLELWWLGLATPEEVRHLNRRAIGTENIVGYNYNSIPKSEIPLLNTILNKIWRINKSKFYIVYNYFENMKSILREFYKVLKAGSYFCLITGCNTICRIQIPTYKILTYIAEDHGFKRVEIGRDEIRNRSLPPDRNHDGGIIKEEWITVFRKGDG